MTELAIQPFSGVYRAQSDPSTFAFAVRHSGVFWYRGSFADVRATLRAVGDELVLEGAARAESISVKEPAAMRTHLLAADFFDAENHPEIAFRSTAIRLAEDGQAEVDGELAIRGITCPITATGRYAPPREATFGLVAGLRLETTFDRRQFGFDWQAQLPGGGDAVSWEVQVEIDLMLMADVDG